MVPGGHRDLKRRELRPGRIEVIFGSKRSTSGLLCTSRKALVSAVAGCNPEMNLPLKILGRGKGPRGTEPRGPSPSAPASGRRRCLGERRRGVAPLCWSVPMVGAPAYRGRTPGLDQWQSGVTRQCGCLLRDLGLFLHRAGRSPTAQPFDPALYFLALVLCRPTPGVPGADRSLG